MARKNKLKVVSTYIENGIKIKVLKGYEYKPKPVHHSQSKQKLSIENNPYFYSYYNRLFREWCSQRKNRVLDLKSKSPYSRSWFTSRRCGLFKVTKENWENIIYPLILKVEEEETTI